MDKKAKNILMKTYWSASGWKDEYTITPKDFTYAKEKGLMFDAVSISHDKCVKQIKAIVEKITPPTDSESFYKQSFIQTFRLALRYQLLLHSENAANAYLYTCHIRKVI